MELTTKRSNFWYILPIVLGLLGGVIAYFFLRKSDSKKAKICLVLGTGISVAYFIYIGTYSSTSTDNTPELTAEPLEREIQATRELEEARYQAELERQRELEETSKFDPVVVKAAKENIPEMQALPKEVLNQCKNIKSFSDYQVFSLAVAIMWDQFVETIELIDTALTILELQGYDKHPEVGPLIKETRSIAIEANQCLDEKIRKYGS